MSIIMLGKFNFSHRLPVFIVLLTLSNFILKCPELKSFLINSKSTSVELNVLLMYFFLIKGNFLPK